MGAINFSIRCILKTNQIEMEIYLFALGLIVIALVVASVLFVNNEEKKKYNDL